MAGYNNHYEQARTTASRYLSGDNLDEWDPRYFDSNGNFRDPSAVQPHQPYSPHGAPYHTQLVPRGRPDVGYPAEIGSRDYLVTTERDVIHRARSSEPGYVPHGYEHHQTYGHRYEPPRHDHGYDQRMRRSDRYYEDDRRSEVRTEVRTEVRGQHRHQQPLGLSKQEKIISAVAGAALLAGGKELYDRHEAKEEGTNVQRNPLASFALAGLGALAAYKGAEYYGKQQAKKDRRANYILQRSRDAQMSEYYSDDEEYSTKEKRGHSNFLESALAATGIGAAVKSLTGAAADDRRSDTRSQGGSRAPSRASSRSGKTHNKVQQAAIASLLAGATEAFRVAKEPGGWKGEKTKRILTAAAGAATFDAAHGADHGKKGLIEAVMGGLIGNRLLNGSRSNIEEDKLTGKSRSRSRSRARSRASGTGPTSSLAALATAGLGVLGAKKAFDRSRSQSRGRGNYDSRDPSRDRRYNHNRSRSIVDVARAGMAKLGIGSGTPTDEHRRRDRDSSYDRSSQRHYTPHDSYESIRDERRGHGHRDRSRNRSRDGRDRKGHHSGYDSESDLEDSDDDGRSKHSKDDRRH